MNNLTVSFLLSKETTGRLVLYYSFYFYLLALKKLSKLIGGMWCKPAVTIYKGTESMVSAVRKNEILSHLVFSLHFQLPTAVYQLNVGLKNSVNPIGVLYQYLVQI